MKDLIYSEEKIPGTKNKYYNLQIGYYNEGRNGFTFFDFKTELNSRQDHCGFWFELCLFNVYIIFYIYDNRHWNYEEKRWMTDEDYEKERKEDIEDLKTEAKNLQKRLKETKEELKKANGKIVEKVSMRRKIS
jgi:hypothetical protein